METTFDTTVTTEVNGRGGAARPSPMAWRLGQSQTPRLQAGDVPSPPGGFTAPRATAPAGRYSGQTDAPRSVGHAPVSVGDAPGSMGDAPKALGRRPLVTRPTPPGHWSDTPRSMGDAPMLVGHAPKPLGRRPLVTRPKPSLVRHPQQVNGRRPQVSGPRPQATRPTPPGHWADATRSIG